MSTANQQLTKAPSANVLAAATDSEMSHVSRFPGRPLTELAILILLVETIMWLVPFAPNPRMAYAGVAVVIALFVAVSSVTGGASMREIGLRFDNLFLVVRRIAPVLAVFVFVVVLIGFGFGTLRFGRKFFSMLLFVPLWAFLQQYLLLAFIGPRLRAILGDGPRSVAITAAVFSLLHLPNPVLTVVCAAGGYIWAREYQRAPNLFANALTHTVASAFLANSLPGWLLKNMVVGYNYFLR
jgi:membrane protease YdiL (CAAX protease family)